MRPQLLHLGIGVCSSNFSGKQVLNGGLTEERPRGQRSWHTDQETEHLVSASPSTPQVNLLRPPPGELGRTQHGWKELTSGVVRCQGLCGNRTRPTFSQQPSLPRGVEHRNEHEYMLPPRPVTPSLSLFHFTSGEGVA